MALVNLGDIKTAVYARGFETDQAARIVIAANSIQKQVIGAHRWRFMLVTATVPAVAGTVEYTLPGSGTLMHIESIRLATPTTQYQPKLQWLDSETMLELANEYAQVQTQAWPRFWTDDLPPSFQVFPAPQQAGTFTVRYLKEVTELSGDSDVPDIPHPYLDILVAGVAELLSSRLGKTDMAQIYRAEKDQRIADMMSQNGQRQRQNGRKVVSSGRYDDGVSGVGTGLFGWNW